MTDELTIVDRDGVRWIEMNRPASRNGLTVAFNQQIIGAVEQAAADPAFRCIVLAGANGSFCSGLDLTAAMRAGPASPGATGDNLRRYFHGLIRALRASPLPTIAAVDGAAAGFGCDLALACDLRLLSDRARFGEIFVLRGLMPDGGGTFMLPRLIGVGRALELMLTGDIIDAAEAHRIGLGNKVIPEAQFQQYVWDFASKLAKGPPLVHAAIKDAVARSLESTLDEALEREATEQAKLLQSKDFVEGVGAFLQKREPKFRGE